jgi:hypothetical protein
MRDALCVNSISIKQFPIRCNRSQGPFRGSVTGKLI